MQFQKGNWSFVNFMGVIDETYNFGGGIAYLLVTRKNRKSKNKNTKKVVVYDQRNASNTPSNTHFSTHSLWLVKFHMRPIKFIWDSHALVRPMWILINQKKCVEKCVLECVSLVFLL